jgi:L-ribulose-5-phosphate 3-epimerase
MDRRSFLAAAALSAAPAFAAPEPRKGPGPICFFSKHLPKLSPGEMAKRLRAVGYGGIELTVRPGGHVSPAQVTTELPKALEAIRAEGLEVPIIATALTAADDPTLLPILTTAGKLGVRLFRPGWFSYALTDVRQELKRAGQALAGLTQAARRAGVELAYQNHIGQLGAPLWDLDSIIGPLDRRWAGIDFDIRHAVAEGGAGSWKVALKLVAPRVKVFSVKDFYWQRDDKKAWVMKDCALGEGMVDLKTPLAILATNGFRGPVTVFNEYEPDTAPERVLAAAGRDLVFLKARIAEVYA